MLLHTDKLFIIFIVTYSLFHLTSGQKFCEPVLDPPRYGFFVTICKNTGGSICEFGCVTGYKLVGQSKITCSATTFQWSSQTPDCRALPIGTGSDGTGSKPSNDSKNTDAKCPAVKAPKNGQMFGTCGPDAKAKSECYFSCDSGYNLSSYPILVCQTTGKWSRSVPTCNSAT